MTLRRIPPSGNGLLPLRRLVRGSLAPFPAALADACGLPPDRLLFTSSGTAALYLALIALKESRPGRSEVLIPAWCCPSVPQAVLQAGLTPVPLDLDPATFAYAPDEISRGTHARTLCLLLVNFFGIPHPRPEGWDGDAPAILRDCAQDFHHRPAPGDADPFFYSFGRGKSLNTGHGGALCFPEAGPWLDAARRTLEGMPPLGSKPLLKMAALSLLSQPLPFGILTRLPFLKIGETRWESPLEFGAIHPSFHRWASACLEAFAARRRDYADLVADYARVFRASGRGKVLLPYTGYDETNVPIRFPVLIPDAGLRNRLLDRLGSRYGGLTRQYPDLLHRLPGAPPDFRPDRDFPGGTRIARELVTLPVTSLLLPRRKEFLADLESLLEQG